MSAWHVPRAAEKACQVGTLAGCQAEGTVWLLAAGDHTVLGSSRLTWVACDGTACGAHLHHSWPQVEDAISQTSQTLQLLIEHDPVSQRLDQLRLDARLSPHMQNAGHSHTLSPLDTKENLEGTLRRRSLRCPLPSPGSALSLCPAVRVELAFRGQWKGTSWPGTGYEDYADL